MNTTAAVTILLKKEDKVELFKLSAKKGLTASQFCRELIEKALSSNDRTSKNEKSSV